MITSPVNWLFLHDNMFAGFLEDFHIWCFRLSALQCLRPKRISSSLLSLLRWKNLINIPKTLVFQVSHSAQIYISRFHLLRSGSLNLMGPRADDLRKRYVGRCINLYRTQIATSQWFVEKDWPGWKTSYLSLQTTLEYMGETDYWNSIGCWGTTRFKYD